MMNDSDVAGDGIGDGIRECGPGASGLAHDQSKVCTGSVGETAETFNCGAGPACPVRKEAK